MEANNGKVSYDNVKVYACAWHRERGATICANGLRRPIADVDAAVVGWIRSNVLREAVIAEALQELRRRIDARFKKVDTEGPALELEATRLRSEIERLGMALATIDQKPEAVIRGIAERQEQLSALEARLRSAKAAPDVLNLEVRRLEKEARARLDDFTGAMGRNPAEARRVLETLLFGPVALHTRRDDGREALQIEGELGLDAMLTADGSAGAGLLASPAGFEPA